MALNLGTSCIFTCFNCITERENERERERKRKRKRKRKRERKSERMQKD